MTSKHPLAVFLLGLAACGTTESSPSPPPSPAYNAPAGRIDPSLARTLRAAEFRILGETRSGPDADRPVPTTSAQRYVSPTGDDSADGSQASPWQSLQHASDSIDADTTVWVDAGDYNGGLQITTSGTADGYVVFRNWKAQAPRLLGGGSLDSVVYIDASYVVLSGFEVTGHNRGVAGSADSIGIQIEPSERDISNIEIRNNWIHDIGPGVVDQASCYYNGHGLIAQAEGYQIKNLVLDGNELSQLYVGHSECLVLNGNIDTFQVTNNYVHDVNNIGIDIIGYEKNNRETTKNGLVADNVVLDASNYWPYCTRGNCAYPAGDESSDGIYVDGGANIVIEYNIVGRADHGIELQSENAQLIRNVEVRFNVVFNSHYKNFTLGDHEGSSEHDNVFFDAPELRDSMFEDCRN